MSNVTKHTPYVAPGAPTSPMILAVAGLLVAVVTALASRLGFEIAADSTHTAMVAGILAGVWGLVQHRLARREQAAGVPVLDEMLTEALAEAPPSPGAVPASVARLLARAAGGPAPRPTAAAGTIRPAYMTPEHFGDEPSGALLGEDGEPMTPGDLDSEEDPDPDARPAPERAEAVAP
jgi:hypothetical protein